VTYLPFILRKEVQLFNCFL